MIILFKRLNIFIYVTVSRTDSIEQAVEAGLCVVILFLLFTNFNFLWLVYTASQVFSCVKWDQILPALQHHVKCSNIYNIQRVAFSV